MHTEVSSGHDFQRTMATNRESHCTKVSDFASLYLYNIKDTNAVAVPGLSEPPLVLLYAWVGASASAILQYVKLYHDKGIDVLVIHGYVFDFLRTGNAIRLAKKILQYLLHDQRYYRKYLVHAFSIGAFNFTMCSMLAKEQSEIYGAFLERLRGMIFDSIVIGSLEHTAIGISKITSDYRCVQWLAFRTALSYLTMRSRVTQEFYERGVEHFTGAPVDKPALFFFSHNDPMCDVTRLQDLLKKWQNENVSEVLICHWPESTHVAHLKFHQQEYLDTWQAFCISLPEFFQNSRNISKDKLSKL